MLTDLQVSAAQGTLAVVAALPAAMTVAMRAMAPAWPEVLVEGGALGGIELTIERPDRRV